MVHPNTALADLGDVRAWAMGHQLGSGTLTLFRYHQETGRGISRVTLREFEEDGLRLSPGEREELSQNAPDVRILAEIARAELSDACIRALNNETPAALNRSIPEVLRMAHQNEIPLPPGFAAQWSDHIRELEGQGEVALQLAGNAPPAGDGIERCSLDAVIHTRSTSMLAAWGAAAIEAAKCSRADMLLALGLGELADDALVRARDLTPR